MQRSEGFSVRVDDVDALAQLVTGRARDLDAAFHLVAGSSDVAGTEAGHAALADALDWFVRRWANHVDDLRSGVEALAVSMRQAAGQYEAVDREQAVRAGGD